MTITFRCENCHKEVKAPDAAAGKRGKCPHCDRSSYILAPVSEEDILPLAPIDDSEEKARQEEVNKLLEEEKRLLEEAGAAEAVPLEHRENAVTEDLYHFVVNYCLDVYGGKLDKANLEAQKLKKFGPLGKQAVADFIGGRVAEPALDTIPTRVLQGFLKELKDKLGG